MKRITQLILVILMSSTVALAQTGFTPEKIKKLQKAPETTSVAGKSAVKQLADVDPNLKPSPVAPSDATWNLQFEWPLGPGISQAGAECDGSFFYGSVWSTTSVNAGRIYKYDLTGTLVDSIVIPTVSGTRDLAWDGTYFYGGSAGTAIREMDFTTQTLVSTITTPVGVNVRHIAYDAVNDAFWVGDFNTDIYLVNRLGVVLDTIPGPLAPLNGRYGSAWDNVSPGGPFLWVFAQGGNGITLGKIHIATGTVVATHDMYTELVNLAPGGLAGGLFTQPGIVPGTTTLGGLVQGEVMFGYNLNSLQLSTDAAVTAIVSPNNSGGCTLATNEQVTIAITNGGTSTINNFLAYYSLNGGAAVPGLVNIPIPPDSTRNFTFTGTLNLSGTGSYDIKAWTGLTGDQFHANDTNMTTVSSANGELVISIYTDTWPEETSWEVFEIGTNNIIASGGTYDGLANMNIVEIVCIDTNACLGFNMLDSYGDGNNGFYLILNGDTIHYSAFATGSIETVNNITGNCPLIIDASVDALYTLGDLPLNGAAPHQVQAIITNTGTVDYNNLPVVLQITGANTFNDTIVLNLGVATSTLVTFADFTPANLGANVVNVGIPADAVLTNNMQTYSQNVTNNLIGYPDNSPQAGSLGFGLGDGLILARHVFTSPKLVSGVNVYIDASALGETIYAVVLDAAGAIVAQSANLVVTTADTGDWHSFTLNALPQFNGPFYAGIAQVAGGEYFPVGLQDEFPTRANAYFYAGLTGAGLTDAGPLGFGRHMLQVVTSDPVTLEIEDLITCDGGTAAVNITVENFNNIAALSLTISIDTNGLVYTGLNAATGLTGLQTNLIGSKLKLSWYANPVAGLTLPDGNLVELLFNAPVAGMSDLRFDLTTQGACEFSNAAGIVIPANYTDGMVTVQECSDISGQIVYDNRPALPPINPNTPMRNIWVGLNDGGKAIVAETWTDNNGNYSFTDVPNGNYTLDIVCTKPWAGANANSVDALEVLKDFAGFLPGLNGIHSLGADVSGDGNVNAGDALLIARRFVGQITQYPIQKDWVFDNPPLALGSDTNFSFYGLCYGDANGSYAPAKYQTLVGLGQAGTLYVSPGQEVEIPFRAAHAMELGAIALEMAIPAGIEVMDVVMDHGNGEFLWHQQGRELRISWFSLNPMMLDKDAVMFRLQARVRSQQCNGFAFRGNSQLANPAAVVYTDAMLTLPKLSLAGDGELSISNYPNPFSKVTTLSYTLPEAGTATLSIYDVTGAEVAMPVNAFLPAGNHSLELSGEGLAEGLYFYTLRQNGKAVTGRMLISK